MIDPAAIMMEAIDNDAAYRALGRSHNEPPAVGRALPSTLHALPYASVRGIFTQRLYTHGGASGAVRGRVQVDCWARDRRLAFAMMKAVENIAHDHGLVFSTRSMRKGQMSDGSQAYRAGADVAGLWRGPSKV